MALFHIEDCQGYGTDTAYMRNGIYARVGQEGTLTDNGGISLVNDPDGVSPGRVIQLNTGYGGGTTHRIIRKVIPTGGQMIVGVGLRVYLPALPVAGAVAPIAFKDAGDGADEFRFTLTVTSTGHLQIRNGGYAGTVLYTSSAPVLTSGSWHHLEWKVVVDASDGSFEVRWEGVPIDGLVQTGINTGTDPITQICAVQDANSIGQGQTYQIKDWFGWDGTGSEANDFLGTVVPFRHTLQEDIALNWSLEGGTDGVSILNRDPPTPEEYIYAGDPPPSPYVASLSPLPEEVTSVKGVLVRYRAAKNDGGDATVQPGLIADPEGTADTWLGADSPITSSQTFWDNYNHVNPKTGQPWLPAELNEAHVQINRTT